jgi:hypothetical protein
MDLGLSRRASFLTFFFFILPSLTAAIHFSLGTGLAFNLISVFPPPL